MKLVARLLTPIAIFVSTFAAAEVTELSHEAADMAHVVAHCPNELEQLAKRSSYFGNITLASEEKSDGQTRSYTLHGMAGGQGFGPEAYEIGTLVVTLTHTYVAVPDHPGVMRYSCALNFKNRE